VEEDSEQTSNEATLSYLDFLANLDSEEVRQEVAKRSAATKEHTRKLLHYVEISGPYSSTVLKEKPSGEIQVEEKAHKGTYVQWDERINISPTLLFLFICKDKLSVSWLLMQSTYNYMEIFHKQF